MSGRLVDVRVDLECTARVIEEDNVAALAAALETALAGRSERLSVSREPGDYERVVVDATLRAESTLDGLRQVGDAVAGCLALTGLFEEFDVTGSHLRAAPYRG